MISIPVNAGSPYEARVERGLIDRAGESLLAVMGKPCAVAILTDDTVDALYGARVQESLEKSGFTACRNAMPHGERNKNVWAWMDMLDFLAEKRLTRTDCVLALGGGVPGDVAGFAAASYLRGIALVQMPTTLLAMVDSSVGGKTGFNLAAGKNLAGAFYQPRAVLCDPDTLSTLPADTLADGVAEAIKHGVLADEALFETLETGEWAKAARSGEQPDAVSRVIARNIAIKAAIVEADEREAGARKLLNLGHTLGHAIEKRSGYTVGHGHAVGLGMLCAARLSQRLGLCGTDVEKRIAAALRANDLPTEQPYGAEELTDAALGDKKRAGDSLTFILPVRIGECVHHPVAVGDLPRIIRMAVDN